MSIALIVCIIGGVLFVVGTRAVDAVLKAIGELGKWAFIIGLAAVLCFGK